MTTLPLPLILAATLLFQGADKPFASDAGNFRIMLPGVPQEQTMQVPSAIGPLQVYLYSVDQDGNIWVVIYNDYPEQIAKADPDQVLERTLKRTVANTKGTLVSKKDIKLDGFPGKEFEATVPSLDQEGGTLTQRARTYLVKKRLYQVILTGPADQVKSKAGDAFFASFALIKKPAR